MCRVALAGTSNSIKYPDILDPLCIIGSNWLEVSQYLCHCGSCNKYLRSREVGVWVICLTDMSGVEANLIKVCFS